MFSLFGKKQLLDKDSQLKIVACIKEAESKTSGEIRVFMEPQCKYVDPMERAREIFASLAMEKTSARNAVLIYIASADRQFTLFGDTAIYELAGGAIFWQKAAEKLTGHLVKNEVTEGLCNCINELGSALAAHFPYDPSVKKNELPDEIVFGEMINHLMYRLRHIAFSLLFLLAGAAYGQTKPLPEKPSPPRLVNDMANMLSEGEQAQLERKLVDYERETSNQITIVTIDELGDYDVSDFAIKLGKAWGVGKSGRNNGIVIIASLKDHKINISTGKGLEGALTDLTCGRIIRNEMVPAFKDKSYYVGFFKGCRCGHCCHERRI